MVFAFAQVDMAAAAMAAVALVAAAVAAVLVAVVAVAAAVAVAFAQVKQRFQLLRVQAAFQVPAGLQLRWGQHRYARDTAVLFRLRFFVEKSPHRLRLATQFLLFVALALRALRERWYLLLVDLPLA